MKKTLLFLFAVIISVTAYADDIVAYKLDCPKNSSNNAYATYYDVTINDIKWKAPGNQYEDGAWRLGGKFSTPTERYIYTQDAISEDVTKIIVSYGTPTLTVSSIKMDVYSTAELAAAGDDGDVSSTTSDFSQNNGNIFECPDGKSWNGRFYRFTWTLTGGSTSSNKFMRLSEIVFYKKDGSDTQTASPSLTKGGIFTAKPYAVTITNNESGATVYYTLDGTDPTTESTSFTGESKQVEISETTTVKAMAVISDKENSNITSATYTYEESIANTLETAYTTAQAIALIDANSVQLKTVKVYVKGQVSKVDSYNSTYGSIVYWLDNNAFEIYAGLNNNGEKFEDINGVKTGAEVVVYGLIKKYNTTYEMDQNNWLVAYTAPTKPEPELTAEVKNALEVGDNDVYGIVYTGDAQEFHYTSSDESVATIGWNEEDCEFTVTALKVGSTTITISTDETEAYQAKTFSYKLNVNEKFVPAAIPFEFDGGKADATPGKGMTATGLGTDYAASPKLKFDSNGDNLIVNIASEAKYLNYIIKGNGNSDGPQTGEFTIEESADGETYTALKSYNTINGQFETNNVVLNSETRYIKFTYVTKERGNVALGAIRITNEVSNMACATFEEYILESESVRYFESETPSTPWVSGGYTFTTYTADYGEYGKYYFSYALSNKTTTEGKLAEYALESSCGKAKSGSNYAVWCDNSWNGGSKVTLDIPSTITGFYVTNTTSTVDAILNGDDMSTVAGGFQNGDYLKLVITGYDEIGNETNSVEYTLAEAKDDKIYYVKAWRWVDLSELGVVSAIDTKMIGTKTNAQGLTTPAYFCMDDFGGVAPETDADMEVTDIPTSISDIISGNVNITAEGKFYHNGRIIIRKGSKLYTTTGQSLN